MPGDLDRYRWREPTPAEAVVLARLDDALARRDGEAIGRAYTEQLRSRLQATAERRPDDPDDPVDHWMQTVWAGSHPQDHGSIDGELWFHIVVAAADATQDDREAWCIGDGPADHLAWEHRPMAARLHAARKEHPGVEAMFRAMQADYESMGLPDAGWWSDGWEGAGG